MSASMGKGTVNFAVEVLLKYQTGKLPKRANRLFSDVLLSFSVSQGSTIMAEAITVIQT